MAKTKTAFVCQNCGARHSQWLGQCKTCHEWNTIVEEVIADERRAPWTADEGPQPARATPLSAVTGHREVRMPCHDPELDRVLGGGLVAGSLVLVGGEPGIGKSTLMLQMALKQEGKKVLYISGEESETQIKLRANRIPNWQSDCLLLCETHTPTLFKVIKETNPDLVIVDSIQTLHTDTVDSSPGSVAQIRETAAEFLKWAKSKQVPVILIGHITKEGYLAGPKVLEHMVDVVLQFEGDKNHLFRIVRSHKNRFGSASELGIYEMRQEGLVPVDNPSSALLSNRDQALSGTAIGVTMEGLRPLLVEVQALVSTAVYGTPQRSATGYDLRRLNMMLAVLEKRCGFRLAAKDVFLNVTGGIRLDDPAADMAVMAAILSSGEDIATGPFTAFIGEVGLTGEIRPVTRLEARIAESRKLGFQRLVIPAHNGFNQKIPGIDLVPVQRVDALFKELFG